MEGCEGVVHNNLMSTVINCMIGEMYYSGDSLRGWRVFSLLDASFNAKKNCSMDDYIIIIVVNVKKTFFFLTE